MDALDLKPRLLMSWLHRQRDLTALLGGVLALLPISALAQQPVQPLPKVGECPLGYYASGSYCLPSKNGNVRGAVEKKGGSCPLGFYSSGAYCVSSPSNNREAIQKQGNSCPLGWYSSGNYCVKTPR
jgi:hypothetical protein